MSPLRETSDWGSVHKAQMRAAAGALVRGYARDATHSSRQPMRTISAFRFIKSMAGIRICASIGSVRSAFRARSFAARSSASLSSFAASFRFRSSASSSRSSSSSSYESSSAASRLAFSLAKRFFVSISTSLRSSQLKPARNTDAEEEQPSMYSNLPSWFTRCLGGKGLPDNLAMMAPILVLISLAFRWAASSSKDVFPNRALSFSCSKELRFFTYSPCTHLKTGTRG